MIDRLAANGIDLTRQNVEVAPIAHYHMGGVQADMNMNTEVPGLIVAGEAVGGANGANRLSGNAITEALVFGREAGRTAAERVKQMNAIPSPGNGAQAAIDLINAPARKDAPNTAEMLQHLQQIMADDVGPLRTADKLKRALGTIDLSRPVPDLWPQFIALGHVPVFALRGANSDVLSAETLEAMTGRHPNLRAMTVPDQGHAPVLKEAAYGLGCTTWEVVRYIILPYTQKGVIGGIMLGMGRALGETMAVTFVIGNSQRISSSLFAPGTSIASTLANEFGEADDFHLSALFALGLLLFLITFVVLALAKYMILRAEKSKGSKT